MRQPLDLLFQHAEARPASRKIHEALTFCFARGDSEERLAVLTEPPLGPSSFALASFASDLFIDELLVGAFGIEIGGRRYEPCRPFLKRVLLSPPSRESTELRQRVLRELEQHPLLLDGLERAYLELRTLRAGLAGADTIGGKTGSLRRRIEILLSLRRAVELLGSAFQGSSSALARISAFAEEVRASEPYARLCRLLDFEDGRSVIETRLQLGYDGSLRRFDVVRVSEVEHGGFSRGRLARLFAGIVGLLKGYRFSEEDVLSQLLDRVYTDLEEPLSELLYLLAPMEFYLGSVGFRRTMAARGYPTCLAEFTETERSLPGLYNPWLVLEGQQAVPVDEYEPEARSTVIVTGPNSGGKTRFLQSIAIAQLLAQVGAYVPARSAKMVWVQQLFLSLVEHVEAGQKEGRLGTELMRIRRVFETSGPHSLIVMDELCSGTNPSEGEQIFEMVIDLFEELGPQVFISTHFLDFAARLESRRAAGSGLRHLKFRQVELGPHDVPTFHFVPGVAKTSLARNTAARLGVTQDELLGLVAAHKRGE